MTLRGARGRGAFRGGAIRRRSPLTYLEDACAFSPSVGTAPSCLDGDVRSRRVDPEWGGIVGGSHALAHAKAAHASTQKKGIATGAPLPHVTTRRSVP